MIQIGDVLVSLDVIENKFICDLGHCKGACCVEGDSGAPLEDKELMELKKALPFVWDDLAEEAKSIINKQGVAYIDSDGDVVTSIVNEKDCVFTHHDTAGTCHCAIEKAYLEGKIAFRKPISCHLYPIRIKDYKTFKAVNQHHWKICKVAEILGKKENMPLYKFLKEPLIRKFGTEWYDTLDTIASEWEKQKKENR